MSDPVFMIALAAGAALLVVAWFLARARGELRDLREAMSTRTDPGLGILQQQVSDLRETLATRMESGQSRLDQRFDVLSQVVGDRIEASRKTLDQRLETTNLAVREVHRSLGEVDRSVKSVSEITRDIRSLQDILQAPKLRGGLGEFFLGDLLAQILPPAHFTLQHGFRSGERVDAVIHAGDRVVPVDAKFPLEKFRRVVQAESDEVRRKERRAFMAGLHRHVDDIAGKYIRPEEGTYDFALMYIPAENVYYEAVLRDDEMEDPKGVLSYALEKRVIPVSPNSFYAYLQVILIGLQGLRIEARTRQIIANLQSLRTEVSRFTDEFGKLGKHIGNAEARYEDTGKSLERLVTRIDSLASLRDEPAAADGKPRATEEQVRSGGDGLRLPEEPGEGDGLRLPEEPGGRDAPRFDFRRDGD